MVFTLIKNELIKIFKRSKTWIVFALFAVCVVVAGVMNNISAQNTAKWNSPQGKIDAYQENIKWNKEQLKEFEKSTETWAKDEIARINEGIKINEEKIKVQEELLKNPNDENLWKSELENEKKEVEQRLADKSIPDSYKSRDKQRLGEINSYLDTGIKPIEEWEFNAVNYGGQLFQIIGLIILAAGIAVFMSDIVSGESTPATLKFLLVQPISRAKVIFSKFVAVVLTVVGMIAGLELAAFGVIGAIKGFDAAKMPKIIGTRFQWDYSEIEMYGSPQLAQIDGSGILSNRGEALLQSFALQILFIVACCALIFLISALFKSSMITMAISVILCVVSTMMCMMSSTIGSKFAHLIFFNYGATPAVIDGSIASMFRNPGFSVGLGATLMLGTIVVSYVLATVIFNKKDILA